MLRAVLLLLIAVPILIGCTRQSTLGASPEGDDPEIIHAMLSPIDLEGSWRWVKDDGPGSEFFSGPCSEYAMFGDWEVVGYGSIALFNPTSGETLYVTAVRVDEELALESMRLAREEFTCSEWYAYGNEPEMLRHQVTPLDTQQFGDDTLAYQFWTDDDPDVTSYGGNSFIIRHGSLVIGIAHTASDDAPHVRASERLVSEAIDKLSAVADDVEHASGN